MIKKSKQFTLIFFAGVTILLVLGTLISSISNSSKRNSMPFVEVTSTEEQRINAAKLNALNAKKDSLLYKTALNLKSKLAKQINHRYNYQVMEALGNLKFIMKDKTTGNLPDGSQSVFLTFEKIFVKYIVDEDHSFTVRYSFADGYDLTVYYILTVTYLDSSGNKIEVS